ncbi:diguanylate cyclase with PAS and GAF sensors [Pseudogulbenkiania sp. NH8B]|uniref:sensor domain-containing protein n=1 Tax=Pseudogulbenkiania sp. (strain NH8B) TaxID=748280 RepID=UPI0002279AB6|nr:GGDEF domain-containing protein [Pseudogulbenkiania sp. NH8B]BAK76368.1 diguanylate cyclase with PAS and GAF sensors [Pseudogulbenkiania sp. NH8B]
MDTKNGAPLASFIDLLLDAICIVDIEGRFVFVSAACERIFGYTQAELIGKPMIELVLPEDRARTQEAARQIMAGDAKPHFENRYVRKDGQVVHIMWSARWSEADQVRVAVARDITERKRAESLQTALYAISEAAHGAEDLLALFQHIRQVVGNLLPAQKFSVALYDAGQERLSFPYHVDAGNHSPVPRNPATTLLCEEVIRTGQPLLLTPETADALPPPLRAAVSTDAACWLAVPLNSFKGIIGALVLKSYADGVRYTEKDKELLQFVSAQIATAIERKQLHARLQQMAQYDELTSLPNRRLLYGRLKAALARARREQGRLSLLYLDLDKFKQVNDSFGHATGDLLLQEVARRLRQCVRESDTVARIGGDEFVVLLESIALPEHAWLVAEKIRSALDHPLNLDGRHLRILPSIGVALFPEHGDEEQQLLKHADDAMYRAKKTAEGAAQKLDDGARAESSV